MSELAWGTDGLWERSAIEDEPLIKTSKHCPNDNLLCTCHSISSQRNSQKAVNVQCLLIFHSIISIK